MGIYSIRDLEHLSGIKAHTLRIWEQRYNFIHPRRTGTNIRFYEEEDLKLVLNISLLKENGYKISRIAGFNKEERAQLVLRVSEKTTRYQDQLHALILTMVDMDGERFEEVISTNMLKLGFEKTVTGIMYPFLSRIGLLWQTGASHAAQEHFMYNLIRQKLIAAIDGQYVDPSGEARRYLLFLPEGEEHEFGLLFAHYLIKSRGNDVLYVGRLSASQLDLAHQRFRPDYMMTIMTTPAAGKKVQEYLEDISGRFKDTVVMVAGYPAGMQGMAIPENVVLFPEKEAFIHYLNRQHPDLSRQKTGE